MIKILYVFYEPPKKYKFSFELWDKNNKKTEGKHNEIEAEKKPSSKNNKRLYRYYKEIKPYILRRDDYKCVKCGNTKNLNVHHIKERCKGGDDSETNLQTLCYLCHMKQHEGERVYKLMESAYNQNIQKVNKHYGK